MKLLQGELGLWNELFCFERLCLQLFIEHVPQLLSQEIVSLPFVVLFYYDSRKSDLPH